MHTTILYKDHDHYILWVDFDGVTMRTTSGVTIHHKRISDDPDGRPRTIITDLITLPLPEFGDLLRRNGYNREDIEVIVRTFWNRIWENDDLA